MRMRHIVMRPAPLYNFFSPPPNFLINGTIFEKKKNILPNTKCVFWFLYSFILNISSFKKKWTRYD